MSDDAHLFFHHFFPHHLKKHPLKNIGYFFDTFSIIRQSELLVIGGGGIFYDHEKGQSINKQIREWWIRVFLARLAHTPIRYHGIGIDVSSDQIERYRPLFAAAEHIGVRDDHSMRLLASLGREGSRESDWVIREWEHIQELLKGAKPNPLRRHEQKLIGISLRSGLSQDDHQGMQDLISSLRSQFPDTKLVGLAFSHLPESRVDDTSLL